MADSDEAEVREVSGKKFRKAKDGSDYWQNEGPGEISVQSTVPGKWWVNVWGHGTFPFSGTNAENRAFAVAADYVKNVQDR